MAGMAIKELGAMFGKNAVSASQTNGQQTGAVSFESIWNNQTEKNGSQEVELEGGKTAKKDDASVRDSLQAKDVRKSTVKDVEETDAKKLEEMDSEELEQAMEVLGAAAVELIQEIAETFDMSVEEVQSIMADLGMEQLDVLQQGTLSELLLAVAGVENSTALLTDGELYQNYQALMEQMKALLEECGEELQLPVENLEEILDADSLPIEITVEDDLAVEEDSVDGTIVSTEDEQNPMDGLNTAAKAQNGEQMSNQTEKQMQSGQETEDNGQNGNLLLQNLKNQDATPQLHQVTAANSMWDADTMDIMRQIMDYMRIQVKPDMSSLELQLHPESLGTLHVNLATKDGAVTAQFVTQNDTVKAILESQLIQLKESFAEQGVKVDAVEVTVQTHQFEQNLEQGRGRQSAESERKQKPRRIRLDGALTMEALDMMEEEEQLAAQMMAANGNTVDFTA